MVNFYGIMKAGEVSNCCELCPEILKSNHVYCSLPKGLTHSNGKVTIFLLLTLFQFNQ